MIIIYCCKCGNEIKDAMICPYCGAEQETAGNPGQGGGTPGGGYGAQSQGGATPGGGYGRPGQGGSMPGGGYGRPGQGGSMPGGGYGRPGQGGGMPGGGYGRPGQGGANPYGQPGGYGRPGNPYPGRPGQAPDPRGGKGGNQGNVTKIVAIALAGVLLFALLGVGGFFLIRYLKGGSEVEPNKDVVSATITPGNGDSTAATPAAQSVSIDDVNFPNDAFRSYVKQNFDDGDGVLTNDEIEKIKKIEIHAASLKGIEYFTELTELRCSGKDDWENGVYSNDLTALNISKNTKLKELYCGYNRISNLDTSNNPNLKILACQSNGLANLNLSNNKKLEQLKCNDNNLRTLDLSENEELTMVMCGENDLDDLNLRNNTKLEKLSCNKNHLSTLDVGNNTKLKKLYCHDNDLSSLDLSNNTNLTELNYEGNSSLKDVDLRNNTKLKSVKPRKSSEKKKSSATPTPKAAVNEIPEAQPDYIFAEANSRYLTDAEINSLDAKTACYAKNEIYARHGRQFQSLELQNYFGSKSWYNGTIAPSSFNESVFNSYEMHNIKALSDREHALAPGGYQLDK